LSHRQNNIDLNRLAVTTGQRRGELVTLRREQLTDEGIVVQSKTGAGPMAS
jgi:integrase